MHTMNNRMTEFLDIFEQSRNEGADAAAALYAETFLVGGPEGARCIRAEDFARTLPKRKEMFEQAGCLRTELASVVETPLDTRYSMARTRWQMHFQRANGCEERIEVESTFIVDFGCEAPRIIAYLAHHDPLRGRQ
jgi:hypothetical protein